MGLELSNQSQIDKMRWILFSVFLVIFAVGAGSTIWVVFFRDDKLVGSDRSTIITIFLAEVGIALVALFYSVFNLRRSQVSASEVAQTEVSFFKKGYPRSQHPQFFAEVETILSTSRQITLVAVGLNLLWEKHIVDLLVKRAADGKANITICMGNTRSPHVEDRLIEEEMSGNRPAVGRIGINKNVKALVERFEIAGKPKSLKIRLFENYLTVALLIFDDDIFLYPYGYQVLGNTSPILHIRNDGSDEARFFVDNAERIIRDSIPAEDLVSLWRNRRHYSPDWIMAAVYLVPRADSVFYQLGSTIIGHDIRRGRSLVSRGSFEFLREYVGEAEQYGFHATLADALLFASEAQIDRIGAELKFLSEEFRPFRLKSLEIVSSPQDDHAVILRANDPSGTFEALHHELVARVYRLATSSTYLAGLTSRKVPSDPRTRLMLEMYGSPFILNTLIPHFTLLSAAPTEPGARADLIERIRDAVGETLHSPVEIDELVLVVKRPGDTRWRIEERFPLSK